MNAANISVGKMAADNPQYLALFDSFGIDYCCNGRMSLADACKSAGADLKKVQAALAAAEKARPNAEEKNWNEATLTELVDHIDAVHHAFLRNEVPRLQALMQKVRSVHGGNHPELNEAAQVFAGLCDEILSHMDKEDTILFPAIRRLESEGRSDFHCGSLNGPIQVMEFEHENAGRALDRLRSLTGNFQAPADGCASYRAVLAGIEGIERDLHRHIHKENNILFPRTLEAERKVPA